MNTGRQGCAAHGDFGRCYTNAKTGANLPARATRHPGTAREKERAAPRRQDDACRGRPPLEGGDPGLSAQGRRQGRQARNRARVRSQGLRPHRAEANSLRDDGRGTSGRQPQIVQGTRRASACGRSGGDRARRRRRSHRRADRVGCRGGAAPARHHRRGQRHRGLDCTRRPRARPHLAHRWHRPARHPVPGRADQAPAAREASAPRHLQDAREGRRRHRSHRPQGTARVAHCPGRRGRREARRSRALRSRARRPLCRASGAHRREPRQSRRRAQDQPHRHPYARAARRISRARAEGGRRPEGAAARRPHGPAPSRIAHHRSGRRARSRRRRACRPG